MAQKNATLEKGASVKHWRPKNISQLRRKEEWSYVRFKVPREYREILKKLKDKIPTGEGQRRAEMDGYLILDTLKFLDDNSPWEIKLVHKVGYRPVGEGRQASVIRLVK